MRQSIKEQLEAAGFTVGSAAQFVGLTPEEEALVETRLALSDSLRRDLPSAVPARANLYRFSKRPLRKSSED